MSLARQSVKESHREVIAAAIEVYSRHLPREFARRFDAHALLSFFMDRFGFLEENFSAEPKVRISPAGLTESVIPHRHIQVETRLPDCAFIVRTLQTFFRHRGMQLHLVMHPMLGVIQHRGRITGIDPSGKQGRIISHMFLLVSEVPEDQWGSIEEMLTERLTALLAVNRDYQPCLARLEEVKDILARLDVADEVRRLEAVEAIDLLEWLRDDNFAFLGYGYCPAGAAGPEPAAAPGRLLIERPLGLLGLDDQEPLKQFVSDYARGRLDIPYLYSFYRTDTVSIVRQETQIRYVGIKDVDPSGISRGEHVFVGLLSSAADHERNTRVPIVRRRIAEVLAAEPSEPGTYSYRQLVALLNSMPLEDLFYSTVEELKEQSAQLRDAELDDRTHVTVRRRPGARRISVTCVMPRSGHSEQLKARVESAVCSELDVSNLRSYVRSSTEGGPVRLHFYVSKYREGVTDAELRALEITVQRLIESWEQRLQRLVYERYPARSGEGGQSKYLAISSMSGADLWAKYSGAFPVSYRETQSPATALADMEMMEKLETEGVVQVRMFSTSNGGKSPHAELRIVSQSRLILNDIVPVLENMRLRANGLISEQLITEPAVSLNSLEVTGPSLQPLGGEEDLDRLCGVVHKVLAKRLHNDRLLGLSYLASLDWQQIELLVAYRDYFLQVFTGHANQSVTDALLRHPKAARLIAEYFDVRFSPAREESEETRRQEMLPEMRRRWEDILSDVSMIQEDIILRRFFDLVTNTVRTNYYNPGRGDVISIKIRSLSISHMPRPRPLFEIYVHGSDMAGIHLRGGPVARGGIRHSDRLDDFRTEIHGLVKTQMTKNAVIVPVGAKGGFIVRHLPTDRQERTEEIVKQYEKFISGLLDLTDNIVEGRIVAAPGVLRYDDDDPYLVVAADKGTAQLSDTANAISRSYRFWLDDAFASGGSSGYDHKALGITARGAWVCVERHFRELGIDLRRESIRVAGVGDMSGDVFGNGLLHSNRLKLVAAFDHRHIFVDPDPDPETSFVERQRLFDLPGSSWTDYDAALLSPGGGVYPREAKSIELSPQAREMLGLGSEPVNGPMLMRRILALDVDLLWMGGIGTYVKATHETHLAVGDSVNDSVRINAADLRARVIGEGANLGLTAEARTEFALAGGLLNTDAIDNSAGVDCSDHEVNLKILTAQLLESGALASRDARDELLREVSDEVADACLANNYWQSALISLEVYRTRQNLDALLELIANLEQDAKLYRAGEHIPADDVIREWHVTGRSLPRNILAVVLSYAKNHLQRLLLDSAIPDLPFFRPWLTGYFPRAVRERYASDLPRHRLQREITATAVANALINQAGASFTVELGKESRAGLQDLVVRYFICDHLAGGQGFRRAVHALDNEVAAHDQYVALLALEDLLRGLVRWWSWNEERWGIGADEVDGWRTRWNEVAESLYAELPGAERRRVERKVTRLGALGFPTELAEQMARLPLLKPAFSVLAAAKTLGVGVAPLAAGLYQLGERLHLDKIEQILRADSASTRWERRFHSILERELSAVRSRFLTQILAGGDPTAVARFAEEHQEHIERIGASIEMVRKAGGKSAVPIFIILDDYRALLGSRAANGHAAH